MTDRLGFYHSRVAELEKEKEKRDAGLKRMSMFRLATFLIGVGALVVAIAYEPLVGWIAAAATILFGIQIKKYSIELNESYILDRILELNRNELSFMMGNKSVFPIGNTEDGAGHIYAGDLDVFGKGSLFQAVNRTGTWEGRNLVSNALLHLPDNATVIAQRREAIAELVDDVSWRQRFFAIGEMAGETPRDMPAVRTWVQQPEFFAGRASWIWIARIASAASVGLVGWMIYMQAFYPFYFFSLIIVNSAIRGLFSKAIKEYFDGFGSRTKLFMKFADLFAMVSKRPLHTTLGSAHHAKIDEASAAFTELARLSNRAELRMNGLVGPLMNGLFLFDIWSIHSIEKWRELNKNKVDGWVTALANIDMLSSFANYKFNHPAFVDATIEEGQSSIRAIELGHPLLPFDQSIKNDYEIGVTSKAHIVTGSNMAGKSTFIRSVGLNLILALNGLPVCAKTFSCTVVSIASCIRITDSLEEHASYFRAELIRLEQVVALIGSNKPYLVLLDEILRGTNSDDKRMGTLAFFRKLKDFNCLAILATHDLVIGKLEEQFPEHYANFCFESELRDSNLHFDYKLRRGVSTSTNATFLMRSLGLID